MGSSLPLIVLGLSLLCDCIPSTTSPQFGNDANFESSTLLSGKQVYITTDATATETSETTQNNIIQGQQTTRSIDMTAVLTRLETTERQASADRRQFLLKFSDLSSQVNALRAENFKLRKDKQTVDLSLQKLASRVAQMEQKWNEKRWYQLPDNFDDLRREHGKMTNKLDRQANSVSRLREDMVAQETKLKQTNDSILRTVRDLKKEFNGYTSMTFAFAHQASRAINASEGRIRQSTKVAVQQMNNTVSRLQTRVGHLDDRTNVVMLRFDVWNMTRALNKCRKLSHDEDQDHRIRRLTRDLTQVRQLSRTTFNRSMSLESILYENNRITNGLSNFKQRASTAIEKLISNIAHLAKTFPSDCAVAFSRGNRLSGVHVILPNYEVGELRSVQCKFTDDNGWTIIQNRKSLDVDFNRKWLEYEKGFGDVQGDYWLGLESIHQLVASGNWKLRIEMWDISGRFFYAVYAHFFIDDRNTNYRLQVDGYYGNASDTLSRASGIGFSSYDFDADSTVVHCARFEEAGWWMRHCHDSNLNGKQPYGIIWYHKPTRDYLTLVQTRMLIAPLTEADLTTTPLPTTTPMTTTITTQSSTPSTTKEPSASQLHPNMTSISPTSLWEMKNTTESNEEEDSGMFENRTSTDFGDALGNSTDEEEQFNEDITNSSVVDREALSADVNDSSDETTGLPPAQPATSGALSTAQDSAGRDEIPDAPMKSTASPVEDTSTGRPGLGESLPELPSTANETALTQLPERNSNSTSGSLTQPSEVPPLMSEVGKVKNGNNRYVRDELEDGHRNDSLTEDGNEESKKNAVSDKVGTEATRKSAPEQSVSLPTAAEGLLGNTENETATVVNRVQTNVTVDQERSVNKGQGANAEVDGESTQPSPEEKKGKRRRKRKRIPREKVIKKIEAALAKKLSEMTPFV